MLTPILAQVSFLILLGISEADEGRSRTLDP